MPKIDSRKVLFIFIPAFAVSTVGLFHGELTADQWCNFVMWLGGAVVAGLTAEHFGSGKK